jgi:hypothetical protein
MPRFKLNRWWTLILVLCLGCACVASMSTHAAAGTRSMIGEPGGGSLGSGSGGAPPPPGAGDPDIPMGSSNRARPGSATRPAAGFSTVHAAGDGVPVDSSWVWYFRVVLQSLGLWSFVRP